MHNLAIEKKKKKNIFHGNLVWNQNTQEAQQTTVATCHHKLAASPGKVRSSYSVSCLYDSLGDDCFPSFSDDTSR
eukprot:m.232640 g.232640  ORF g.232640 m.232640 type:complete len:75 (+) comp22445_c4_seq2:5169-5393(+)